MARPRKSGRRTTQDTGASATPTGPAPQGAEPLRVSGKAASPLREMARKAGLIRKTVIELGLENPEDARLDAIYILALGIHNISRRLAAREADNGTTA